MIKIWIIGTLTFFLSTQVWAQKEEMRQAWKITTDFDVEKRGLNEDLNLLWSCDNKSIAVFEASSGKKLWAGKFKTLVSKLRSVDEQIPMYDSKCMLLFEKKSGKDQMVVLDIMNGKTLWSSEKYQNLTEENIVYISELESFAISTKTSLFLVKARTGEEVWETQKFKGVVGAYVYNVAEKTMVMINFKPTILASLFAGFKNQLVKINMTNGDILWDTEYNGLVERKVVTKELVLNLDVKEDRVFLTMNGLQVFDYATGKPIWSANYDLSLGNNFSSYGVYDAIAEPLYSGSEVYLFDMKNRRNQFIKKYDIKTGKLIWSSPEIKDAKIVPNIYNINDIIVLQVGGVAQVQQWVRVNNTYGGFYSFPVVRLKNFGPYNLQAFNANTGKQIWESERFKRGITNTFPNGDKLMVCSGKALYSIDAKTGKELYEVSLKEDKIDDANKIIDFTDQVIVIADKGVSAHKKLNGSKIWSVRTKKGEFAGVFGTTAFYESDNGNQFAIDLQTGKYKIYEGSDNLSEKTENGEFLYAFEGDEIFKLVTK